MSIFKDALGQEWRLEFDAFLMDRIEREAKVDLADLSAGGLLAVERDVKALVRVLVVACEDQRKERSKSAEEFQKAIRNDAITWARKALQEALADFFPEKEWSAMLSNLTTRKTRAGQMTEMMELAPAFAALPEAMKTQLFKEEIAKRGNSPSSTSGTFASAPDIMPRMPVDDSPVNAESAPGTSVSEISG